MWTHYFDHVLVVSASGSQLLVDCFSPVPSSIQLQKAFCFLISLFGTRRRVIFFLPFCLVFKNTP